MRQIKLIFIFLIAIISSKAQNKQILYNFTTIPETLMTNPGADVKYKWFMGVPMLSGISANVGSSGFSAYDLFAKDGVDFNTKLQNVLLSSSENDKVYLNQQLEIFNAGFKIDDNAYASFGIYQEFDLLTYLPTNLANLVINGNKDYIGKVFELNELNVNADLLTVFHFGYHKQLNEKFILGGRAKIYSGIFNLNSTNNEGYLYTVPSEKFIYEQVINSDVALNTSGIAKYTEKGYSGDIKNDVIKKSLLGGNLGLGFDIGFTYYPQKKVQITASILDVGFIRNSNDVKNYTLKGFYKYEGLTPDLLNSSVGSQFSEKISDAIALDSSSISYTKWRPIKINASYQYSFDNAREKECYCEADENYKNSVGLQFFAMTTTQIPFFAATIYYKKQLLKSIQAKATYTIDSFSYKNIGLGLATTFGKFNFYALADNLLEYRDVAKANSLSFQFGFNIIFKEENIEN